VAGFSCRRDFSRRALEPAESEPMRALLLRLLLLLQQQLSAWPSRACRSDLDCSLNGRCSGRGRCLCDPPWTAADCGTLQFEKLARSRAQQHSYGDSLRNHTTWGGGIVHDVDSNEYHLYAAAITNNCLLKKWGSNSRVEHAVSTSGPEGPWVFRDVAIDVQAHNPAPLRLADGRWVIFHIGEGMNGTDGGRLCSAAPCCLPKCSPCQPTSASHEFSHTPGHREAEDGEATQGSTVHASHSPYGPWLPVSLIGEFDCNNPAPWQHKNGTIYIVCGSSVLLRSERLEGPYHQVAVIDRSEAPVPVIEDAALWIDAASSRWHILFHGFYRSGGDTCYGRSCEAPLCRNTTVSAHAFSTDGIDWHWAQTPPYTATTELVGGGHVQVATRERPKPFFDRSGRLSHLATAVVDVPHCGRNNDSCAKCKTQGYGTHTIVSQLQL
jgi:hypothetical protein